MYQNLENIVSIFLKIFLNMKIFLKLINFENYGPTIMGSTQYCIVRFKKFQCRVVDISQLINLGHN